MIAIEEALKQKHRREAVSKRPRADSNCALRLRRPTLCPLSYGGNEEILSSSDRLRKPACKKISGFTKPMIMSP